MVARYRLSWTTPAGLVTAVEPTPDEIRAHAAELARGYNDPANASLMGHTAEISEDEVADSYAELIDDGGRAFLAFCDGAFVGDADLRGLHGGGAEFAFMIGARHTQGKGLGTKLATMICKFGFETIGLATIYGSVVPENVASRRVFEKLGFVLDDSPAAREFADEPGDLVMAIGRETFRRLPGLDDIRIEAR
ncbi:MAG TPA: GNAT family N-acetyltransferase [Kofleriaceae bacterium]|jgi:RimJ/RimL family protein N-acetyltransferase